jgi:hypothetical protein
MAQIVFQPKKIRTWKSGDWVVVLAHNGLGETTISLTQEEAEKFYKQLGEVIK